MHVIYVDDEQPALDNFRLSTIDFQQIDSLHLFLKGEIALEWVKSHKVDVAFLDMEMSGMHGLELAKELKKLDENIQIVFVTAYIQFALEAFHVDAIGYVLKPYTREDIKKELDKALRFRPLPPKKVVIDTIPTFIVHVDGEIFHINNNKSRELLALLVDRGGAGVNNGEIISCLWPDRPNDANSKTLVRMTFKRLMDALKSVGIDHIVTSCGRRRYLKVDEVECDLYKIMSGDTQVAKKYSGQYMREYSWAEERNGQLYSMILK